MQSTLQLQNSIGSVSETQSYPPWQPRANVAVGTHHASNNWIMDSEATHHLTSDLNNLALHQPYQGDDTVLIADGTGLSITHTGSLSLPSTSRPLNLNTVLCVPNIHKNLISISRLCKTNHVFVEFLPFHFQVKDLPSGAPLLRDKTNGDLYEWPMNTPTLTSYFVSSKPITTLEDWHFRLGHPSSSVLKNIVYVYSLPCSKSLSESALCPDCPINKTHKLPFAQNTITSNRPLQYIFSDVWSSPILSIDNYKYYLIFIDNYTRYTWYYPLKTKSQVRDIFIPFQALVENKFQIKIGTLYTDNGGEFIALRSHLSQAGVSHMTSPPHTPEHNGITERKHRHLVETGMTLLTHAGMPSSYWTYAFATYLINRQPTPILSMESPYQKLFGETPNYNKLRVYGCLCYPWLRPNNSNKLQDRSTPCVLLGYSLTQSAYLCLQKSTGCIYTSRHVNFDEKTFPFRSQTTTPPASETPSAPPNHPPVTIIPTSSPLNREPDTSQQQQGNQTAETTPTVTQENVDSDHDQQADTSPRANTQPQPTHPLPSETSAQLSETQTLNLHINLKPLLNQSQTHKTTIHPMQTRRKNNITKPKTKFSLSAALSTNIPSEPRTVN